MQTSSTPTAFVSSRVSVTRNVVIIGTAAVPPIPRWDQIVSEIERMLSSQVIEALRESELHETEPVFDGLCKITHRHARFEPGLVKYTDYGFTLEYRYAVVTGPNIPFRLNLEDVDHAVNSQTNLRRCFP